MTGHPPPVAPLTCRPTPRYDDLSHTDKAKALHEKDHSIMDYQETVDILNVKVRKLEQLVKLKDRRIAELATKLRQAGLEA